MADPHSLFDHQVVIKKERCRCLHLRQAEGDDRGHASPPEGLTLAEPCQNFNCDCADFRPLPEHPDPE